MFKRIPVILTSEQLLDRSFKKAKKIQVIDRDALFKKKKMVIAQTESFANSLIMTLERYVKEFPSIDNLPKFYQEIIDIKIDSNKLKKSLGAVDWARKTSENVYFKQVKSLKKSKNIDFLKQKQTEIYGRISSIVKQVNIDLIQLAEAQNILRLFPEISDINTVVIAGYPNVGKSSLLRCLSSAKPKVAQYPFTTKEIHLGIIEKTDRYYKKRIQLIDTPGLLDRSFSERNDIEKEAIAALSHLADSIVFILDVSETCGYTLEDQEKLLSQIKKMFHKSNIIVVENKTDIRNIDSNNIKISCETNKGIDDLIEKIFSIYDMSKDIEKE